MMRLGSSWIILLFCWLHSSTLISSVPWQSSSSSSSSSWFAHGLSVTTVVSRRQALEQGAATVTSSIVLSGKETDAAPNAKTLATPASSSSSSSSFTATLPLSNTDNKNVLVRIPRVGYSLYKTNGTQVAAGVTLALAAGVRHFDCATQYGTNDIVGQVLRRYIEKGDGVLRETLETNPNLPIPSTTIPSTASRRRQELFVTHKVSNAEQSLSTDDLQRAVLEQRNLLLSLSSSAADDARRRRRFPVLNFMAMVHSPLTDKERRLRTYAALVDLKQQGQIAAVGVCHYGVYHLNEIVQAGLPPPDVIQLVLSPFNQHKDVAEWATHVNNGAPRSPILSCSAWSKLSSTVGPQEGWTKLGQLASQKGSITKQQLLIQWAVQKGYLCVPRSGAQYKVERAAIIENSWESVARDVGPLTDDEMAYLDALDEQLPAGQLGVVDGWEASDIVNDKWDPTLLTV